MSDQGMQNIEQLNQKCCEASCRRTAKHTLAAAQTFLKSIGLLYAAWIKPITTEVNALIQTMATILKNMEN
jgi:hypothetical protein